MAVRYYTDDCSYRLPQKRLTARWLHEVAQAEGYTLGDVTYIFCSAQRLLELNRQYQTTILISSHILDELAKLATHYGFIDGGRMVREMSAAELEAACRKCMRLEVTDTRALARALDELGAEYRILSEDTADVYERLEARRGASKRGLRARLRQGAGREPRELLHLHRRRCAPCLTSSLRA